MQEKGFGREEDVRDSHLAAYSEAEQAEGCRADEIKKRRRSVGDRARGAGEIEEEEGESGGC